MNTDMVAVASVVLLIGFILYLAFRRYQVSMQLRMQRIESFNRLVEKFAGAKEFVEFAQSPQGKTMLEHPASPMPSPLAKALRFLQAGVVLVMVGIGFWINALSIHPGADINYIAQARESSYWGTLNMCLGIGFIMVAGITYYFVKRWHLANGSVGR